MDLKVAEYALAAMDSEPVYQWCERYEEGSLWEDCTKEQYYGFAKNPECEARVLYTAPPTPVCSRPLHPAISSEGLDDETLDELIDFRRSTFEYHSQQGNKVKTIIHGVTLTALLELRERRAAMLQAGNSPVIPDGWIKCGERIPEDAQWCAVITEYGYYVQCWSDRQGWLGDEISIPDCDVTHWMPLPAAPQREGK